MVGQWGRLVTVCRRLSACVVCNAVGGGPGAWADGRQRAGRMGGRATDAARRASTITSRYGYTLFLATNIV